MSAEYPLVRNFIAFSTRFGVSRRPSRVGSSPSSASSCLISSCIVLFYISAAAAQSADALYADRANLASARKAADLWAAAAKGPADFDAAWKLSRADYWLGGHAPQDERRGFLEQGIAAGQAAITLQPTRPEGYFWMAASMGALAESFGLRAGIKYRKPIKDALETTLRLDPGFQQGSADRALGRWYSEVPRLFGGDRKQAEAHLRAALTYNPGSTVTHFFLAQLFEEDGRTADARREYQTVIDSPLDPEWAPEDRDFKAKAADAIKKLR
jgi:tetratricopeptide (TPR) repeat protein